MPGDHSHLWRSRGSVLASDQGSAYNQTRSKEALFTPGTSLMAGFRVHGGRRAGAQSYSLVRQVKATRPGHVLPQAQVSWGRSLCHHQSWGLRQGRDICGAGKLHTAPFLPDAHGLENLHSPHIRTSQSSGHTHIWPGGMGTAQASVGSADTKVLSGSVTSPPTREAWSSA